MTSGTESSSTLTAEKSKRGAGDPMGSYDFGWMWAELGIADLRR